MKYEMEKRTVKIKFVGFWPRFYEQYQEYFIYKILAEEYDVQISDDPEYIICSLFEPKYDYCNYPQVRIMISGENYVPDYNLIDYSISSYPISYLDRNFYSPVCFDMTGRFGALQHRPFFEKDSFLKSKKYFANFIASHESEYNYRGDFFKKLCQYKRVESAGSYLNNMENGYCVDFHDNSKYDLQSKCKFSLCFESTQSEGFITEKITDAFYSNTIPIYYGSQNIGEIFNKKAFINCSDYSSFDEVINRVIEIDNDDELFMEIINQPVLNNPSYVDELRENYREFVLHIFEQPYETAYRRSRVYSPYEYDCLCAWASKHLKQYNKSMTPLVKRIQRKFRFW